MLSLYAQEQMMERVLATINIVSIHSPTVAIFNYILWGYILPKQHRNRMEKAYG